MSRGKVLKHTLTAMIACAATMDAHADCDEAVDSYNSALEDVGSYLRRYTACIRDSAGQDDCSAEFGRLRSAQSDFEDAVSEYEDECD